MLAHLFSTMVQNPPHTDDVRGGHGTKPANPTPVAVTASAAGLLPVLSLLALGCATAPQQLPSHASREVVIGYDDNHPQDVIAFPTSTYESVTRFELPVGEHHPLRLRLQAGALGRAGDHDLRQHAARVAR